MRKFAIILLRDLTNGNHSLVIKEVAPFLDENTVSTIVEAFKDKFKQELQEGESVKRYKISV